MDKTLFDKFGRIYIFSLVVIYVASLIYGNLGGEHVTELLNNNLHYATKVTQDSKKVCLVCSIKNTGYRTLWDVKILLWSNEVGFSDFQHENEKVTIISKETKHNYVFSEVKVNESIYPGEIKTFQFYFDKKSDLSKMDIDSSYNPISLRVYSANVPAIKAEKISKSTSFEIGPYLYDLLWATGWTYISIGLFIVLPLALILFAVLALITKVSNTFK